MSTSQFAKEGRRAVLERLLALDLEALADAQAVVVDALTQRHSRRVVIFGAGPMGRFVAPRLRAAGMPAIAFCDNDPHKWGKVIDDLPVISADQAVQTHRDSVFVVTVVKNAAVCEQLRKLGLDWILLSALSRLPMEGVFPILNMSVPHHTWRSAAAVLEGLEAWSDEGSKEEYLSQILWRATLDERVLRPPLPAVNTYFGEDLFRFRDDETFVDCGAFDGDSVDAFLQQVQHRFARIVAIEPDPTNFAALEARVGRYDANVQERITMRRNAVGESDATLMFNPTGTIGSALGSGGVPVLCRRLDSQLEGGPPPTLIKMDLEGAELGALAGVRQTARTHRPVLCVCLYHKEQDLWEIPLYLKAELEDYELFLRRYAEGSLELICYAVPSERLA